jgi:hypothetical protein
MDNDRVLHVLTEIRDLQGQLIDSYRQVLRNQQDAINAQAEAAVRIRRLQKGLGLVILLVLVIVLILLAYVIRLSF